MVEGGRLMKFFIGLALIILIPMVVISYISAREDGGFRTNIGSYAMIAIGGVSFYMLGSSSFFIIPIFIMGMFMAAISIIVRLRMSIPIIKPTISLVINLVLALVLIGPLLIISIK